MVGRAVGREAVEDVQRLEGGAPILLGHLAPELAQHGVVDVVPAGDLVGDADETLDVLALDGLVVGLGRLEHDLFELGRGEALDLAVDVGRELGGGLPGGRYGGYGGVLYGFNVGHAIAMAAKPRVNAEGCCCRRPYGTTDPRPRGGPRPPGRPPRGGPRPPRDGGPARRPRGR